MVESVIMLVILLTAWLIIAPLASASGHGNIHLLEEEIAEALKICTESNPGIRSSRTKREDRSSNMDAEYEMQSNVQNDTRTANVLAVTVEEQLANAAPEQIDKQRMKRGDRLTSKAGDDECLSQCVFANMQVVDARGIPREPELWSRVQNSVTSQQSRAALRDQLRSCFQELQSGNSDAEDDGCSYSNKLEGCLTLHLSDRNISTGAKDNS